MNQSERLLFLDYLKNIPAASIFNSVLDQNDSERKILSSDFLKNLSDVFITKQKPVELFNGLSMEDKLGVSLAYLSGDMGVGINLFASRREELLSTFLVYAMQDESGIERYYGFRDCDAILLDTTIRFLSGRFTYANDVQPPHFFRYRALNDIMMVLVTALYGGMARKNDGTLMQNALTICKRQLQGIDDSCTIGKRDTDVNIIVAFLLEYAIRRGMIAEEKTIYSSSLEQIRAWGDHSAEQRLADIQEFCFEYMGIGAHHFHDQLLSLSSRGWMMMSALPDAAKKSMTDLVLLLHYTAVIDVVKTPDDLFWKCCTPPDEAAVTTTGSPIHVLPDFTTILPQEITPEALFAFCMAGSITSFDRVYRGLIERAAINETLSIGGDSGQLVSSLQSWNTPENVVVTVKEWIREYQRLFIVSDETVICSDERTTRQILSYEPFATVLVPVPAHTVFKIKKGREREVREILTNMGFDPRLPEERPAAPIPLKNYFPNSRLDSLSLVTTFAPANNQPSSRSFKGSKYSVELKELDLNEIMHVIDYALVMNIAIRFDYIGSAGIRKGIYLVTPSRIVKEKELLLEGCSENSGKIKSFLINKIKKIGVVEQ